MEHFLKIEKGTSLFIANSLGVPTCPSVPVPTSMYVCVLQELIIETT